MSAAYFKRYFNELSSSCLPVGASKLFLPTALGEYIIRYERIKWVDLSKEQKAAFLALFLRRPGISLSDNDMWVARAIRTLLVVVDYLLTKNSGKIDWFELRKLFSLNELILLWETERDPNAKSGIYDLLNSIPGWPHNIERSRQQFGYITMTIQEPLTQISNFSRKQLSDLMRYLGGAKRLGGDPRLALALEQMFSGLTDFPSLREPVLTMVREKYDQKTLWKVLPAWAKGMVLEHDLGM